MQDVSTCDSPHQAHLRMFYYIMLMLYLNVSCVDGNIL